ncbi:Zinc finger ring-type protein [Neofusicoccum parvum]|uniref:Zinc finger ring-type protein n=1 Tax=Neofusicoccum parvum TaxID=310453 RepID=A0ACB5SJ47_9PEZI|nr:Zinc finger ring-type protein [Neofusicoccum parvum]
MAQNQEPATRDEFLSHGIEEVPADEVAAAASNPDAPGGTQECMVCLEDWESRDPPEKAVRIIACGHWVGSVCITLLNSNTCPLCRTQLYRADDDDDAWVPPPDPDDELLDRLAPDFADLAAALAAAQPLARHALEAAAASHAADRAFDRTAAALAHERDAAVDQLPPPPPSTPSGAARDLRPHALVPAFEAVSPRDLLTPRAQLFRAGRGAWLTVRPAAFAANFASLARAFRAARAGRMPGGDDGDEEEMWAAVARVERSAVGAWAREHEAELWRAVDLRDALVRRARMALAEEPVPVPGAGLVVVVLVDWLVGWRRTREVEVWGGLIMDPEPEEEGEDEE